MTGAALKNKWTLIGLYFVAVLAAATAVGAVAAAMDLGRSTFALVHSLVMLVALAGALWVCLYWWRRTDEAAKEAHKWSFFWGASVGLAALGVVFPQLLIDERAVRLAAAFDFTRPGELVVFGLMLALVFQGVGYLVAWAMWWLKRR